MNIKNCKQVIKENNKRIAELNDKAARLRMLMLPLEAEMDIIKRDRQHLISQTEAIRNALKLREVE